MGVTSLPWQAVNLSWWRLWERGWIEWGVVLHTNTHTHLRLTPAEEASQRYSPVRNARLLLPRLPRHLIEAEETDKHSCYKVTAKTTANNKHKDQTCIVWLNNITFLTKNKFKCDIKYTYFILSRTVYFQSTFYVGNLSEIDLKSYLSMLCFYWKNTFGLYLCSSTVEGLFKINKILETV